MTAEDKCVAIVQAICQKCADYPEDATEPVDPTSPVVSFGPDWHELYKLTVYVGNNHTHVAGRDFNGLVDQLYLTLVDNNPRLSWGIPIGEEK